ncbi:a-kinase anchor protein 10, mitochondrial [Camelus ferus]|nr:a-kinase anchor protein 10, mitochondrial [Camelus ferus]
MLSYLPVKGKEQDKTSDVKSVKGRSCLDYQTQETKSSLSKTLEQHETTAAFVAESLDKRLEDSRSAPLPLTPSEGTDLNSRTSNTQNHLLLSQECHSAPSLHLEMARTGARPSSTDTQESSRLTVASRNSPSSPLKELSGKLMKSIEQDAVNTFTKYISPDAAKPIPITEAMRNDIIAKICGEDGQVDPNCFVLAQSIVFSAMEREHFSEFLRSHHFCKYQIEVLTSGAVYLADILFCESALFYFSEYMEKEDAVNILQFWLAADNFQSQLAAKKGQYDGQEAQNDAMILYDKYFSLQATHPLGFDDVVRLEIESNICREGGPLPNCFTTPLRQAWTTMEKSSVKKASVKILKNFDEAIIVDAASLDPESLYQRTYAGKMTFGRVSDLGQFIRESEPEPDVKKSKGRDDVHVQTNSVCWFCSRIRIINSLNAFFQAQEELAWKIAKMIVGDVMQQAQRGQPQAESAGTSPLGPEGPQLGQGWVGVACRGIAGTLRAITWRVLASHPLPVTWGLVTGVPSSAPFGPSAPALAPGVPTLLRALVRRLDTAEQLQGHVSVTPEEHWDPRRGPQEGLWFSRGELGFAQEPVRIVTVALPRMPEPLFDCAFRLSPK